MSDFLSRLAERTLGLTQSVLPLNAPRYAPDADMAHSGAPPTELEAPERVTDDARPLVSTHHPPLESTTPAQEPVRRRGDAPDPTENKHAPGVADEEAAMSPDPASDVSLDMRSVGAPPSRVDTSLPEVQESTSSPTTEERPVPRMPDSFRPGLPLSARNRDDTSPGQRTEAEHDAWSTSDARPMTTPSDPGDEDAPVLTRRDPDGHSARAHNVEQTQRIENVPEGERRGGRLSGRSVEDHSDEESALERPVESPFARSSESSKSGGDNAPSPRTPEDNVEVSPSEPTVRVTIGRIDVRAVSSPAPAQRRVERPSPGLSLDAYLRSQSGRRRE